MEKNKFRIITLLTDIVILVISFLLTVWIKHVNLKLYTLSHSIY